VGSNRICSPAKFWLPAASCQQFPRCKRTRAATLATLSSAITRDIFTLICLPKAADDTSEVLKELADKDTRKEALCRALLLSAYNEAKLHEEAVGRVETVIVELN
jgi:hypothetical protein